MRIDAAWLAQNFQRFREWLKAGAPRITALAEAHPNPDLAEFLSEVADLVRAGLPRLLTLAEGADLSAAEVVQLAREFDLAPYENLSELSAEAQRLAEDEVLERFAATDDYIVAEAAGWLEEEINRRAEDIEDELLEELHSDLVTFAEELTGDLYRRFRRIVTGEDEVAPAARPTSPSEPDGEAWSEDEVDLEIAVPL